MEARIFFPFFVSDVISFYKHNMYRKSTQTNMFLFFFFISEYNFLMSFKQSSRASHICIQCNFCLLLFKSTTVLVCYVGFVVFIHTKHRFGQGGLHTLQLVSLCSVQRPLSCLCVLWYVCMFEIYMLYRTCPSWHLHVVICSKRTLVLIWYLHLEKMAAREVGGRRG